MNTLVGVEMIYKYIWKHYTKTCEDICKNFLDKYAKFRIENNNHK